jgi:hypothetical protein
MPQSKKKKKKKNLGGKGPNKDSFDHPNGQGSGLATPTTHGGWPTTPFGHLGVADPSPKGLGVVLATPIWVLGGGWPPHHGSLGVASHPQSSRVATPIFFFFNKK